MDKLLFVAIMCIVPALIASIIHNLKRGEKKKFKLDYKLIFFYFSCFLTVICLFKTVIGHGNALLLESYTGIELRSVTNYASILLVLAVAVPLVARLFPIQMMYLIGSIFFFLWSLEYFMMGGTHNMITVVSFVLASVISIVWVMYRKKEVAWGESIECKKDRVAIVSVILFGIITTYIYIPQETYLANIEEMVISYDIYALHALGGSVLLAFIYILGVLFLLSPKQRNLYMVLFFAINFGGYLQANFLNGEMKALDGIAQVWDKKTIFMNAAIWILVVLLVAFVGYFAPIKEKGRKIIQIAAIYISLMQVVSLVVLIIGTESKPKLKYSFTTEAMLELDEENNVIVFVLDWFDQQILDDVVESDPTVLENFKDFTWYKNATSQYAYTTMAIPYLMTGIEWQTGMKEHEYINYSLENSNYLSSIYDKGYNIGIYSEYYFAKEPISEIVENVTSDDKNKLDYVGLYDLIEKSARYRMSPFGMKENYIYYNGEYDGLLEGEAYPTESDVEFYAELRDKGITVSKRSDEGSFRLYHLRGSHAPYNMDADCETLEDEKAKEYGMSDDERMMEQTKGCLKIVATYIEQLKKNGLFDNATIIITADHGQNLYLTEEERVNDTWGTISKVFDFTSTPIMFVKTEGESGNHEIRISQAPVSHREVLGQILRSVGIDNDLRIFSEIEEDEVRERTFIRGRYNDIPFKKYVINGHARDEESWKEVPLE